MRRCAVGGAMRNGRTRHCSVNTARKRPDIMEAVKAGYHDVLAGLGYRAEYDAMPQHNQRNYEVGRFMGAEVMARAGKPPAWPANVRMPRVLEPVSQVVFRSFVRQPDA
jgi:hypothetical protein